MESKRTTLINQVNALAKKDRIKALKKYQGNKEGYLAKARIFYAGLEEQGINTSADKVESINMFVPYVFSPDERRKSTQKGNKLKFLLGILGFAFLIIGILLSRR